MSERFFQSNTPGYPQPVCSELESSGIRVAVSDLSVTECRRWRPPYQTRKTCTRARNHWSVSPNHSENVVKRIGLQEQQLKNESFLKRHWNQVHIITKLHLALASLSSFGYLQTSVTSKFNEYWLVTVVCHQQILRILATDRRLSLATQNLTLYPTTKFYMHSLRCCAKED